MFEPISLLILHVSLTSRFVIVTSQAAREIFRDDFDSSNRKPSTYRWNTIADFLSDDKRYNGDVEDIFVRDGFLKLSAVNSSTKYVMAVTTGKFRFRYGEVESRLRAPHGKGLISKFILVPDRCSLLRCSDSIDDNYPRMYMTELSGISPFNQSSLRSDYYLKFGNQSIAGNVVQNPTISGQNFYSDFHLYRMVWKKDSLTWFIDGQKVFETTNKDAIAHAPMRIEISLYVNTKRGGGQPDEKTVFPAIFEIDYIVVRQENPYAEPDLLFSADFSKNVTPEFLQSSFIYGIVNSSFIPLPADSVKIANGSLQLSCFDNSRQYEKYRVTIQSVGHFDFLYGDLQFRARFPSVQDGSAYAIIGLQNYLCGADNCERHDDTPEVALDQEPGSPMDNHAQVSYTTPLTAEVTQRYTAQLTEQLDLSASGHNYKLIWTPTSLRWFVDDQAVFIVADVKKIPKIRMYMYFTLFCNPGVERDGNSSNVFHQLWIESISVRKLSNLAETEEVVKTSVWEGWKYGVLFGILGGVLFCLSIAGAVFLKKWRAKERLGWRSRDRLSFKNNSLKMRMENDYLHRTISVPLSAGIYVIPPENLTRSDIVLGKGEHGIVFKGIATGLYGKVGPTVVAVKTLFSTEDNTSADASFKKELDVLARCGHHLNIVNLLGVVTTGRPSLLIEYCQYGSLLSYLREHRPPFFFSHVSSEGQLLPLDKEKYEKEGNRLHQKLRNDTSDHALLSTKDLINFAYQLARGMEYLASRPIVHRDLAARNVLVDKGKIVKISDFGMARQEGEYVLQDGSIALPIRWMSPTAVLNKTFNQSTDVWSYGVLLWELFTLGELPYGDRKIGGNTEAFLQEIIDGLRLPKPELSPNDMHDLMRDCWVLGPDTPCPTFEELKNRLDSLISQEISEYYTSLDALYEKFNEEHERVHGSEQLSDQLLEEQNPIH